jgi:hypothetical protein
MKCSPSTISWEIINYTPKRGVGSAMAFLADKTSADEQHTDGKVVEETIRLLEKHKGGPFFIAAGFYKPHCPWITPKKYFDRYSLDKIRLPELSADIPSHYPSLALASSIPCSPSLSPFFFGVRLWPSLVVFPGTSFSWACPSCRLRRPTPLIGLSGDAHRATIWFRAKRGCRKFFGPER